MDLTQQPKKLMSIEDVSPDQQYETSFSAIINSPRTLEACKR